MLRTAIRSVLAAVLIAAHVPLPAGPAAARAHDATPSCCAPKACCEPTQGCAHDGACGGDRGLNYGVGFSLAAGGCHDQTPRVTPVQLDPTLPAPDQRALHVFIARPLLPAPDDGCPGLPGQPLVPPPRA